MHEMRSEMLNRIRERDMKKTTEVKRKKLWEATPAEWDKVASDIMKKNKEKKVK